MIPYIPVLILILSFVISIKDYQAYGGKRGFIWIIIIGIIMMYKGEILPYYLKLVIAIFSLIFIANNGRISHFLFQIRINNISSKLQKEIQTDIPVVALNIRDMKKILNTNESISQLKKIVNAYVTYTEEAGPIILIFPGLSKFKDKVIAFVLGHELGHVVLGHLQNITKEELAEIEGEAVGSFAGGIIGGILAGLAGLGGLAPFILGGLGGLLLGELGGRYTSSRFSRKQELEADTFGASLMVKAGYDISGAYDFFAYLKKLDGSFIQKLITRLFGSHPPASDRLKHLKKKN